jgi:hypothetical protein
MNVIDSLIVELKLDTSKFTEDQKKATETLRKFEEGAEKTSKNAGAGADKLTQGFALLQNRLLSIASLFLGGMGVTQFTKQITALTSETGYLASSLGVSVEELGKWRSVGASVGASANEIAAGFSAIQKSMASMQLTGQSSLNAFAYTTHQTGQGPAVELYDAQGKWKSPTDILMGISKWAAAQKNKAVASQMLSQLGMSQGMTNLLMLGPEKLQEKLKEYEKYAPSEEQTKKLQHLQETFGKMAESAEALGRTLLVKLVPIIEKVIDLVSKAFDYFLGQNASPDNVAKDLNKRTEGGFNKSIIGRTWNWAKGKLGYGDSGDAAADKKDGARTVTPDEFQKSMPGGGSGGGGTRGDRNNNPGNLKYGPLAKKFGATGADDKGFAIFPTRDAGSAAQESLVKSDAYSGLTLDQFAQKYAEGDAGWKKTVGGELGIKGGDVVNNNDPRLVGAIRKAEGTAGSVSTGVPDDVLGKAGDLLRNGASTGELQKFMSSQGYPKSGAWCGQFAASVVKSAGGTPPKDAAIASNWMNWGQHVDPSEAKPGDIAVRKSSRYGGEVKPGAVGGHVGLFNGMTEDGQFLLRGGNQGRVDNPQSMSNYVFRRGVSSLGGSRAALDRANSTTNNNTTSSSATHIGEMHVTVPPGADPAGYASGIKQELQRYDNVQNANTGLF